MTAKKNHEIRLKSRPAGAPHESNFELVETPVPEPVQGQVLVRNLYMSVDPYMIGRLYDRKSYVNPFEVGGTLEGGCVGRIEASRHNEYNEGDFVLGFRGWREYYVSDGSDLTRIDAGLAPVESYLGAMGMPGMTAYYGLLHIGRPREGETVFVSSAAGAVGSIACQIAKIKGCRVLGSAGSEEKTAWLLNRAGVDAAINYKEAGDLTAAVGKHAPGGIDIYYDNVGGNHLEAAIEHMNDNGRIVLCGMISLYSGRTGRAPRNLIMAVTKRLTLQGFIIRDHPEIREPFHRDMAAWIAEEKITWDETILDGIDHAPEAFLGLLTGRNLGKMLVRLAPHEDSHSKNGKTTQA